MSVDDGGLETLKKAAEADPPGQKAEYRYKTRVVESALPAGAATESTLQTSNSLLTTIRDNADTVESLLTILGSNTDGIEGLIAATNALLAAIDGRITSSSATLTNVAASASSVQLLASNSSREGASFYNDSNSNCYVKLGTTASTSSFAIKMEPKSYFYLTVPIYTGPIDAIWDTANGNMRVTELT